MSNASTAPMEIELVRYSDRGRVNLARNAAIYLGKDDRDNIRRPLNILRMGHTLEIFRGEYAEFSYKNVSKEVYDHLTTYTTRNMRVTCGNRASVSDGFSTPSDKMNDNYNVFFTVSEAMRAYQDLARTETPQVARSAMPCGAHMSEFVIQFNFATLIQAVFPQRLWSKGAQSNTMRAVQSMYTLVSVADPELWRTAAECYGTRAMQWQSVYRTLQKTDAGKAIVDDMIAQYSKSSSIWG